MPLPAPPASQPLGRGFDVAGVLVEIIAGEGGDDAKQFANELFVAYLRYIARNGLEAEIEETGPGKFSFVCEDPRAFDLFLLETGVHSIQRVPRNDKQGRKHTSFVAVATVRLVKTTTELREADLEETMQRGHGKGGQNQNKVSSAIRLRHRPTGLEVFINGRDQWRNRQTARRALAGKLQDMQAKQATRASYGGAGRGAKIRTYNLGENRIVDHRTGAKCHRPELVIGEGQFQLLHQKSK